MKGGGQLKRHEMGTGRFSCLSSGIKPNRGVKRGGVIASSGTRAQERTPAEPVRNRANRANERVKTEGGANSGTWVHECLLSFLVEAEQTELVRREERGRERSSILWDGKKVC